LDGKFHKKYLFHLSFSAAENYIYKTLTGVANEDTNSRVTVRGRVWLQQQSSQ
jgi:hypothetical protein